MSIWNNPQLQDIDIIQLVEGHNTNITDACRFVAEKIFVELNKPKVTAKQVYNRYYYLKKKNKTEQLTTHGPNLIIRSSAIKDNNNKCMNMNRLVYTLIDDTKLVKKILEIYKRQTITNKDADINHIIRSFSTFFDVPFIAIYNKMTYTNSEDDNRPEKYNVTTYYNEIISLIKTKLSLEITISEQQFIINRLQRRLKMYQAVKNFFVLPLKRLINKLKKH